MKLNLNLKEGISEQPAAFGRLCVETKSVAIGRAAYEPAAFGRLCVETLK